MSGHELILRLTAIIRLISDYPQGLSMLLGVVPPPTLRDIEIIINSVRPTPEPVRVDGGGPVAAEADRLIDNENRFNMIIDRCGGWKHINAVARDWAEVYPTAWKVVVDSIRYSKSRVDGVNYDFIAKRNHLCRDTVYRIINNFPQELATAVMNTPIDGMLRLSG